MRRIPVILFLFAFIACHKEDTPDESLHGADAYNRTIRINTLHVYDVSIPADSILPDVTVEIYSKRQYFEEAINADAIRTTDSTGFTEFLNRNADYYWIIARHDELGIITDSVSTPANTISLVELLFY